MDVCTDNKTMMNIVGHEEAEIQLNGMKFEDVQDFKYLRAALSVDGSY